MIPCIITSYIELLYTLLKRNALCSNITKIRLLVILIIELLPVIIQNVNYTFIHCICTGCPGPTLQNGAAPLVKNKMKMVSL